MSGQRGEFASPVNGVALALPSGRAERTKGHYLEKAGERRHLAGPWAKMTAIPQGIEKIRERYTYEPDRDPRTPVRTTLWVDQLHPARGPERHERAHGTFRSVRARLPGWQGPRRPDGMGGISYAARSVRSGQPADDRARRVDRHTSAVRRADKRVRVQPAGVPLSLVHPFQHRRVVWRCAQAGGVRRIDHHWCGARAGAAARDRRRATHPAR